MQYQLIVDEKIKKVEDELIEEKKEEKTSLTPRQEIYRNYLKSPTWKRIREEALAYYSYTCQSCKNPGKDVHHISYPEEYGQENLRDLIVLCRKCHDLEHAPKPKCAINNEPNKIVRVHVRAISNFLSEEHTKEMKEQYPNQDLHLLLISDTKEGEEARQKALKLLGIKTHYGLYDYVKRTNPVPNPKAFKRLQKQKEYEKKLQEEKKQREIQKEKNKQIAWKKLLEEHNPRLYRKLNK